MCNRSTLSQTSIGCEYKATMASVENFRGFINETLNAAAEEIFRGFRNAVGEYEEEIDRLRRMLDFVSNPAEILPQNVHIEVVDINPQLMKRESSSVDQHDPEAQQIKEEEEEPSVSQKEGHVEPKQEADAFMLTLSSEGSGCGEELIEKRQDLIGRKLENSGPTEDPEAKLSKTHCQSKKKHKSVISNTRHYSDAHKKPRKCDPWGKHLGYASKLPIHLRQHSGEKLHLCEICGKRFAYKSIRDKHVRIHAGDNPDLCQRACQLTSDLKSQTSHTAETPHCSPMCEQQCGSAPVLKAHLKTLSDEKPYSCQDCGECFTVKSALMSHLSIHNVEKPFLYNVCGETFASKSALKSHPKIHTGDKPYSCDTCGRKFSRSARLQAHLRVHTGEKPFPCNICGRNFSQSRSLQDHLRVHTGEKPYSCKECGKCFRVSRTLLDHMRIHTGEKPYSCKDCGKCFTVRSTWVNHMRIHTGERPYSCKECGRCFTVQCNLMRHQSIHAGEKPYTCGTCSEAFRNAGDLKDHIIRNHKTEMP